MGTVPEVTAPNTVMFVFPAVVGGNPGDAQVQDNGGNLAGIAPGPLGNVFTSDGVAVPHANWESALPGSVISPPWLPLSAFFIDFPGAVPWEGGRSVGDSVGKFLNEIVSPPVAGPPQNGHGVASFNGTTQELVFGLPIANPCHLDQLVTASAGTVAVLVNLTSTAAAGADASSDPSPFVDDDGGTFFYLTASASGARAQIFSGGIQTTPFSPLPLGSYHVVMCRFDGVTLQCRVDRGPWQSVACGPIGGLTNPVDVFVSAGGHNAHGLLGGLFASKICFTDTQANALVDWIDSYFNLAL